MIAIQYQGGKYVDDNSRKKKAITRIEMKNSPGRKIECWLFVLGTGDAEAMRDDERWKNCRALGSAFARPPWTQFITRDRLLTFPGWIRRDGWIRRVWFADSFRVAGGRAARQIEMHHSARVLSRRRYGMFIPTSPSPSPLLIKERTCWDTFNLARSIDSDQRSRLSQCWAQLNTIKIPHHPTPSILTSHVRK